MTRDKGVQLYRQGERREEQSLECNSVSIGPKNNIEITGFPDIRSV